VHYDLPWTPMRLEQREGRAVRLGSHHPEIEIVRFGIPEPLEQSLRVDETLARKATLPARAGLGPNGRHVWRWRSELAAEFRAVEAVPGAAAVLCDRTGILAGFALHPARDPAFRLSASVIWMEDHTWWTDSPDVVTERLRTAATSQAATITEEQTRQGLALLAEPIKQRLAITRGNQWVCPETAPAARRLGARLNRLIVQAARARRSERLMRLQRALEFVAGGHTAGESHIVERLAALDRDHEVESILSRMPSRRVWDEIDVRLTGLIIFVKAPSDLPRGMAD
jgi:hypothetical protein